ncbi:HAD family hydrolase [Candidatus Woesebacteria bacterium]|nr:HAD family hydrolase [Candidatus Woesebacteria bacterium]
MYNYILFDWDGCLAHTLPLWIKTFQAVLKNEYGIDVSLETVTRAYFKEKREIDKDYPQVELNVFFSRAIDELIAHKHEILLQDYAEEMLKTFKKKGKTCAIVSSSPRPALDELLDATNIKRYFTAVYGWEDTEKNKPYAMPLLSAMNDMGAKPSETIMIGDTDVDILAGKAAGIATAWYFSKENSSVYDKDQFAHLEPDYIIRHFKEFVDLITKK